MTGLGQEKTLTEARILFLGKFGLQRKPVGLQACPRLSNDLNLTSYTATS
jgi:hypothetical protein